MTLSAAMPDAANRARTANRVGENACQTSRPTTNPSGTSQWSVTPRAASPRRTQASAPVRNASADPPPSQKTPNS